MIRLLSAAPFNPPTQPEIDGALQRANALLFSPPPTHSSEKIRLATGIVCFIFAAVCAFTPVALASAVMLGLTGLLCGLVLVADAWVSYQRSEASYAFEKAQQAQADSLAAKEYSEEIGITMVSFKELVYVQDDDAYQPFDEIGLNKTILSISGSQFRDLLNIGGEIPDWFSFPEVIAELKKGYPPRSKQGFTLFFTGLSGSGKSTLAKAIAVKLNELQDR